MAWIQSIAEYGRQIYRDQISVPEYIAERNEIAARLVADLTEKFGSDCDQLAACIAAFYRFDIIETDIILAQVALLEAIEWRHQFSNPVRILLPVDGQGADISASADVSALRET